MPNRSALALALVSVVAASALEPGVARAEAVPEHRPIHFPVQGPTRYTDDFGAPRNGGRFHEGNDIMGSRLQRVVAATFGVVTYIRADAGGLSGNMLTVTDADGWSYRYMHLNNDSPGTDDGANPPQWILAPGLSVGTRVGPGQHVAYLGDSGNAEGTAPHAHFEMRRPDGSPANPFASLRLSQGFAVGSVRLSSPPPPPRPAAAPRRPRARRVPVRRRRRAVVRRARRPARSRRR